MTNNIVNDNNGRLEAKTKTKVLKHPMYISPSAYYIWKTDRPAWYRRYWGGEKTPQNVYMVGGAVFDGLVKMWLSRELGKVGIDCYVPVGLDEAQIDSGVPMDVIITGRERGRRAFDVYRDEGSLGGLFSMMSRASYVQLTWEHGLQATYIDEGEGSGETGLEIPLFGYPDLFCAFTEEAKDIGVGDILILDWKVGKRVAGHVYPANPRTTPMCTDFGLTYNLSQVGGVPMPKDWYTQLSFYAMMVRLIKCGSGRNYGTIHRISPDEGKVFHYAGELSDSGIKTDLPEMWKEILMHNATADAEASGAMGSVDSCRER